MAIDDLGFIRLDRHDLEPRAELEPLDDAAPDDDWEPEPPDPADAYRPEDWW